jgi:hypothetical protein
VVSVRVEGRPLTPLLPYDLRIEPHGDDFQIVEPAARSFAGRLALPFVHGDKIAMLDIDVPSSGTFSQDDLYALWLAGQELATWRARRALATTSGASATPEIASQAPVLADWHALEQCSRQASLLLREWPTLVGRHSRWLPVGIGGGFADLDRTEREVSRRGYITKRAGDQLAITRSARWFGKPEAATLGAASEMASRVITLVERTVRDRDRDLLEPLTRPIREVWFRAATPAGKADPEPSSWSTSFLRFVALCIQVLAELEARTSGGASIPFLDTDELYEAWLAVQVREIASGWLEAASEVSDGAVASWCDDAITYDLRLKPSFRRSSPLGAHNYRALVADELVPDIVISATRGIITEFAVLDAKAWFRVEPENVLSESAKYLYGIRRVDDDALPAIASVDLVSCAMKPEMPGADDARIGFVHATPTSGGEILTKAVERIFSTLSSSIEAREQEASLR